MINLEFNPLTEVSIDKLNTCIEKQLEEKIDCSIILNWIKNNSGEDFYRIIVLYFGLNGENRLSTKEIALELGNVHQTINQKLNKALYRIRNSEVLNDVIPERYKQLKK